MYQHEHALAPAPAAETALALSVVVPIYDEEESIPALYQRLTAALQALGQPYEVLAIDDGSRDRSYALLKGLAAADPAWRIVRFRRNFGQTAAFSAGFDRARGAVVVTIDADLQNDPQDIGRLLEQVDAGFDVVSGWRIKRQDTFLSRRLPSIIANYVISKVTGVRLHDYGCSLKAYRLEVVKDIHLYGELHRFIPAIASWQGVSLVELPVNHHARQFGRSKYGLSRTFRVVLDLITVRFLLSYQTRPMQVFGKMGLSSLLLGGALGLYLSYVRLVQGQPIAERPLLLLAVLMIVLGVQFLALGLLAELMTRIYYEGRSKAIYVVKEELNAHSHR